MKDLGSFDYPIERIVLVDNFVSAFALQPDNGIPILPYYEGPADNELKDLSGFLRTVLLGKTDIRGLVKDTFFTRLYHEHDNVRDLAGYLSQNLVFTKRPENKT